MPYEGYVWQFLLHSVHNAEYLVFMYGIYCLVCYWSIFDKAFEPGWGALIPFYNNYLYCKITWGKGWLFLLLLIPYVNIIFAIITSFKLARAFGKGFWFGMGLVFLRAIYLGILAFGEPRYQGVPEKGTSFAL